VDQVLDDLPLVRSLDAAHVLWVMRPHSDEQLAVLEQTTPGTPRLLIGKP
jgi:6-phosphogluconate dehydrogenase (decarboxylating)